MILIRFIPSTLFIGLNVRTKTWIKHDAHSRYTYIKFIVMLHHIRKILWTSICCRFILHAALRGIITRGYKFKYRDFMTYATLQAEAARENSNNRSILRPDYMGNVSRRPVQRPLSPSLLAATWRNPLFRYLPAFDYKTGTNNMYLTSVCLRTDKT